MLKLNVYPKILSIKLIQGAPCAGGVTPPQETFKRLAKPLSGVQARTVVRPNICEYFAFGSFH